MAFAGLVALEGAPLHAGWRDAWPAALRRRGWVARLRTTATAVFLDWSTADAGADADEITAPCPRPEFPGDDEPIVACDARIDAPAMSPGGAAELLTAQLDATQAGASFEVLGEFALARWNPSTRQLLLACDAVGCSPLYVTRYGGCTAFSTDLPMLLALPGLSRRLDTVRLVDQLLATGATPVGSTCYVDIRQVPSGTQWRLDAGDSAPSPLVRRRPAAQFVKGRDDAAATLRALIEEAVHCRLDDRVVAVHLSGGLDSSTIACLTAQRLRRQGRRLLALCSVLPAGIQGPENDERQHIEAVLAQEDNIDPVWVSAPPEQADIFGALPQWLDALGCPPLNNATHPLALLGAAGRAHGVEVVLNGFGGDLFASSDGTGSVLALLRRGQWLRAWNDLATQRRSRGWRQAIRRELLAPVRARISPHAPPLSGAIVRQDVLEALQSGRKFRIDGARQRVSAMGPQEAMCEFVRPGNLDYPTSNMVQFLSRAHGQEMRLPLLDLRIVEFMQRVPVHELQRGGVPRGLFRSAVAGIVPESIRLRPDKGPAFDPAVMSRIAASRDDLQAWANDEGRPCWQFLNRERFLAALAQVRPAARQDWRADTFSAVLMGGSLGKFIDWHAGREATQWD
jgi:asparagine synthase (glutamine-hydrolysing)